MKARRGDGKVLSHGLGDGLAEFDQLDRVQQIRHVLERDMNGCQRDAQAAAGQEHDGPRRSLAGCVTEGGDKFRVARVPETRSIEKRLVDGIGHHA